MYARWVHTHRVDLLYTMPANSVLFCSIFTILTFVFYDVLDDEPIGNRADCRSPECRIVENVRAGCLPPSNEGMSHCFTVISVVDGREGIETSDVGRYGVCSRT